MEIPSAPILKPVPHDAAKPPAPCACTKEYKKRRMAILMIVKERILSCIAACKQSVGKGSFVDGWVFRIVMGS
jgi:hypothetical protein